MEQRKVLLIDDEIDFCLLMKMHLEKKNCVVSYCIAVEEGLMQIELGKPDLIVTDTRMRADIKEAIQTKISTIEGYDPGIWIINSDGRQPVDREQNRTLFDELEDLVRYLKNIFKKK